LKIKIQFKKGYPITYSPVSRFYDDGEYITILLQNFDEYGKPKGEHAPILYNKRKAGITNFQSWKEAER
jgi:hypothetical protein